MSLKLNLLRFLGRRREAAQRTHIVQLDDVAKATRAPPGAFAPENPQLIPRKK